MMRLILSTLCTLWALPAFAELTWQTTSHDLTAETGAREVRTDFTFTNTGDKPLTIREILTGCDCTTAQLDKKTFAPNESGVIHIVFKTGERVGEQKKTITVKTDDPNQPESSLDLKITIPQLWIVSPRFVFWRVGQDASPQEVKIRIASDAPQKLTGADVLEGNVKAELREIEPGKLYTLILTPADLQRETKAMILVHAEDKTLPLVPVIYASILPREQGK